MRLGIPMIEQPRTQLEAPDTRTVLQKAAFEW